MTMSHRERPVALVSQTLRSLSPPLLFIKILAFPPLNSAESFPKELHNQKVEWAFIFAGIGGLFALR